MTVATSDPSNAPPNVLGVHSEAMRIESQADQIASLTGHAQEPLHASHWLLWSALFFFILVTLYALGLRTLVPPDEGRYAEIGREMFASGDWVTTRLNGIKYFEKPPLQAWMNALTFSAFGLGEWQARLWTGLSCILGVLAVGWAGRTVFSPRVGFYAALVLASSLFWLAAGQINSLDMSLSGMMTVCLAGLLIAQSDTTSARMRRNWMLVTWGAMAGAVLAKGLVGLVLPGAVLVLYTVAARDWDIWRRLHLGKGLLLFVAIAAPWFILVALRNPEQPHFFFIHEHFERFLTTGHKREGHWYYFIALLIPGVIPWLGVFPQSLAMGLQRRPGKFQPALLLLIWSGFIFIFFSASSSKLPGYIVPIFPALAMLTALYLAASDKRAWMFSALLLIILGVATLVGVPYLVQVSGRHAAELGRLREYQPWLMAAGASLLTGGVIALHQAWRAHRDMAVMAIAVTGFIATHIVLAGFEPYGRDRAGIDLLPAIQAELRPDSKVYSVGLYEQSLTFYLRRPVILVDYWDEFSFGLQQEPQHSLPTVDAFFLAWQRDAAAGIHDVAIVSPSQYAQLTQRGLPMRLVAHDTRRLVIANLTGETLP